MGKWKKNLVDLGAVAMVLAFSTFSWATPVQWTGTGANNHWYEAVLIQEGVSWDTAKAAAEASGGYLATSTSSEENSYIFSLVADTKFWFNAFNQNFFGPWLGGFQQDKSNEPAGNWQWVSGEAWVYSNWEPSLPIPQPDNSNNVEDYLHFHKAQDPYNSIPLVPSPTWNDLPVEYSLQGYIIEWNTNPSAVPLPGSLLLLGTGLLGLRAYRRRWLRKK